MLPSCSRAAELSLGLLMSTGLPYLLHQIFEQQAAATPMATAVCCERVELSYREIQQRSDRLAGHLVLRGVTPRSHVGLWMTRQPDVYIAMLAILKAGAAYVPLDPEYPEERIRFILEDCAAKALVTCGKLGPHTSEFAGPIIVLDDGWHEKLPHAAGEHLPSTSEPEDLCYIIYTSGTTGRPKGVEIEHRSACHFVKTERDLFQVSSGDKVFQGFSLAFDASVEEIWLAFAAGATLVVGTSDLLRSGPALSKALTEAGVTVLSCVPTLLSMLEGDIPPLRLLILGGEVCPPELIRRWWRPHRRVVNTYGPTEATVVATYAECHPEKPVTIGHPLPGTLALVVDEKMHPVLSGQSGELVLGGKGLARGYLGKPGLTEQKFVQLAVPGSDSLQRFYRTGDLARYNSSGELEFLGRIDDQVKIRGFRVELSEIESVLMEYPEITAAAASVQAGDPGPERLVAFVVLSRQAELPADLPARLRSRLPPYMIPAGIEVLPVLPTLPSGKVNRKALPLCGVKSLLPQREIVAPASPFEAQLVEAWSKLFQISPVSTNDDFFLELGGHSLLAARMVSELRRLPEFASLSMGDVYRFRTPASLAAELYRRRQLAAEISLCTQGERPGELAGEQDPQSIEQARAVPFLRHFLCGLGQLVSLVLVLSFFALQWLAPYLTYTVMVEEEYGVLMSIVVAFASLVLLYPFMLVMSIVLKWLIIGRYKEGVYPLWGWYYFRFWLATAIESTVPVGYLAGTPLLSVYLRLMGARVGRRVFLASDNFAIYDLLSIGDDSSVNADATLLGYRMANGHMRIGRIDVGKNCFVGSRAALGVDSSMGEGATLEDLSLLSEGMKIGPGETWLGSPAQRSDDAEPQPRAAKSENGANRTALSIAQTAGLFMFPILVVAALFPGIALMNRLNYLDPYYWYLLLSPLVAVSFIVFLCLEIAGLKWLLLGRIRPESFDLNSWHYVRKWFVDKSMELSLDVIGPLYASVYLSPWYKLLGAKLGDGAEISTASFISPDLLSIGSESFIADNVSLGAPRVSGGRVTIGPNSIGRRAFIGNSALLPPGTVIGDDVLIGCLSVPPRPIQEARRPDTAWLGSPALFLPQRLRAGTVDETATFRPTPRLRVLRATIEFVRVITPSTGFIILTSLLFSALLLLHDVFSLGRTLMFFPVLYLGCGLVGAALTILAKWSLVGRYRAGERPLWSTFVWRNELINALHEHLAGPFLINSLTGTPFLCVYLRLLGAKIGRRVYMETTDFSEFDLVKIGEQACLNADCTIQTHLFEDRVMKMSALEVGPRCSVGAGALVLYDTRMETNSKLGPLSLLMKGEVLPPNTAWLGIPARKRGNQAGQAN